MTNTPLLTLRPLAKTLGVSATWLKAEAEAGRIPSLKAGRRVLFNLPAVEAALAARAAGDHGSEGVRHAK